MEIGGRMLSQEPLALLVPAVIYTNSLCFGRTRKQEWSYQILNIIRLATGHKTFFLWWMAILLF
jgi:hypothetical protein